MANAYTPGPRRASPPRAVVSRADVAAFMLAVLDRPETFGQTIGIAN